MKGLRAKSFLTSIFAIHRPFSFSQIIICYLTNRKPDIFDEYILSMLVVVFVLVPGVYGLYYSVLTSGKSKENKVCA